MIAKLTGLIDQCGSDWAVIDVSGVGYLVYCSARTLGRLVPGEAASLVIETHVREDHIHLYGFLDEAERAWFKLLTTVQGVGAKVGLGILSVLSGDELLQAIAAADKATITRAPGVGPKLAVRLLSELKDKVATMALGPVAVLDGEASPQSGASGAISEAVSALVNLGYSASDAYSAVSHAATKLGEDASLEELIRGGLGELAPRQRGIS
ncbi:MAG: Holliday junction branch migration protein RuvA [Rhodospirillaceae bacterium]|nr:Holliday junction branch migration protein RuvA [Rhodospirillaceae bacterium]MBL6941331.1 Holliday junction branch migration protein RuvA [Rhodospirillales bacterium]